LTVSVAKIEGQIMQSDITVNQRTILLADRYSLVALEGRLC